MKNILMINQKGGTGKTTISDEIAFSFDRTGTKYNFYDLDGQGGSAHHHSECEDAVVSVIDTPGRLDANYPLWIKEADIIVVPTIPSPKNIEALMRTSEIVKANAKKTAKIIYVINQFNGKTSSKEFAAWYFSNTVPGSVTLTIPYSEYVRQAEGTGSSVLEIAPKSSPIRGAMANMINTIRAFAGLSDE